MLFRSQPNFGERYGTSAEEVIYKKSKRMKFKIKSIIFNKNSFKLPYYYFSISTILVLMAIVIIPSHFYIKTQNLQFIGKNGIEFIPKHNLIFYLAKMVYAGILCMIFGTLLSLFSLIYFKIKKTNFILSFLMVFSAFGWLICLISAFFILPGKNKNGFDSKKEAFLYYYSSNYLSSNNNGLFFYTDNTIKYNNKITPPTLVLSNYKDPFYASFELEESNSLSINDSTPLLNKVYYDRNELYLTKNWEEYFFYKQKINFDSILPRYSINSYVLILYNAIPAGFNTILDIGSVPAYQSYVDIFIVDTIYPYEMTPKTIKVKRIWGDKPPYKIEGKSHFGLPTTIYKNKIVSSPPTFRIIKESIDSIINPYKFVFN